MYDAFVILPIASGFFLFSLAAFIWVITDGLKSEPLEYDDKVWDQLKEIYGEDDD